MFSVTSECAFFLLLMATILHAATIQATSTAGGTIEYCRNNSHINGSWIPNKGVSKTFICCGGANRFAAVMKDDFRNESVQGICLQQNTVATYLEFGPKNGSAQCGDDCCKCDREEGTRFSPSKREQYVWQPSSCKLHEWNATRFCELLGPRKVLMVGDSTMQQTSSTLMSMVSSAGGTCGPQLVFGRSDFVGFASRQQHSFLSLCDKYSPDIAIITIGAHMEDEGDFTDMHRRVSTYLTLREQAKKPIPKMVFKSMNPPHLECQNFGAPTDLVVQSPTAPDKYNYRRLYKLDQIMREVVRNGSHSGFQLLSMEPLYLRPDAHVFGEKKDCMHYCQPGPLDLFSVLFLQMLENGEV